ncbi:MAG: hypothetical protein EAZ21_09390 [Betaproteobacteria bacterium]|nr:MAG: hypothetical protein EAZ21_09390 [Betaproteobacteria bacterium]
MTQLLTSPWEARVHDQLSKGLLKEAARTASDWRRAQPNSSKAEHTAGDVAIRRGDFDFALKRYQAAVSLDPSAWTSWANLSNAARYLHEWDLYLVAVRRALEYCDLPAKRMKIHSNLLVHLHSIASYGPAEIRKEIDACVSAWNFPNAVDTATSLRGDTGSALRVAMVSGHFHGAILSATLPGVATALDPARIDLTLVDTRTPESSKESPSWLAGLKHVAAPSHEAIKALKGKFQVWIDLDGHAPTGTLHWQTERIAPIQVSWLDWFNTTGLPNMDYWLGDAYSNPPDLDAYFTERIWRLPHFRLPYCVHPELDTIGLETREFNGKVRFGAFGRVDKHNGPLLDAWGSILKALPGVSLTLKAGMFEGQEFQRQYRGYFSARGVRDDQIRFLGNDGYKDHLAAYRNVDVVVDSFPYNGGVSTFDALSMGRPVLSIWGQLPVSRQSGALMDSVGFGEFCRADVNDYINTAIDIGNAPAKWIPDPKLLRERFLATPMARADKFAQSLTDALEAMWREATQRA